MKENIKKLNIISIRKHFQPFTQLIIRFLFKLITMTTERLHINYFKKYLKKKKIS